MEKIKYLIIVILLIVIGMIYKQLLDYQNISSSLLNNNTEKLNEQQEIKLTLEKSELENQELKEKIISLEESLSLLKLKFDNNYIQEEQNQTNIPIRSKTLNYDNNESLQEHSMTPNITIDDENKVTGFQLEYSQKF